MATIDLKMGLNKPNDALQIGDIAFFTSLSQTGSFKTSNSFTKLGVVRKISQDSSDNKWVIKVNIESNTPSPSANDYLFFAKSTKVNYSGVSGYYSSVTLSNNKTTEAELYAINSDIVIDSK